ncbi:uncharacterized protein LOC102384026 isoform X4 [Alligator sinensis]|uniref:Uncharacterized protein LOC102384026 isoform X4 n=1 Tax=Alligator sinensis TaxID=38654 RepID=A0A3Q0GGX3_ALLSI|nr:uncharacterized protein LOC102384026 isoform X4 [Alligator sinensis]
MALMPYPRACHVRRAQASRSEALDSVYFTGFTEADKTFVIVRLARRPNGVCEIWLFLRVDGVGEFQHPVHPDMIVADESEKCWSGGGLTIECLEPHRRWKIAFQGLLRKGPYRQQWSDEEGELVHVKFSLCWTTFTDVFDFKFDSHPDSFARALALEKWSRELFQRIKRDGEQHSRYEQWGQQIGEIEIENHQKRELFLRGIRTHSYGIRNWEEFYRYVMLLMHFEDGTSAHLTVLCKPATTTHLAVGYVLFPNGKKAGIDWTDASLAEMADDGIIKDTYRVSFTADGKSFSVCATLDKEARPMVYNGLIGKGVFHECIADFQLNSSLRGWGLVECYYSKIKPGNLQELCKRCSEMFNATRLSREIEDAVLQRLEELGLQQELLAVRPSPVGEDTTDKAAAGHLQSELGIKGRQQVCGAILACWASLYSFPAVRYRHQRGQLIPSLMGVVIQQMVPAEAAGTLFTCDPLTGHPGKIIIKGNYGIGESTVTSNMEPDTITLLHSPKSGLQVTSKKIGSKKQYVHLSVGGGTMMLEDSHPTETSQCCISDDIILKVAGLALWVRKAYGSARDIEWAVKENLIYFLQARPMTSFNMESDFELMHEFDTGLPSDLQWLTTATISEAAPGAITPLTWSVFGTATQYVIQQLGALNGGLSQLKLHSLRGLDMYCGHLFLSILSYAASCEPSNVLNQKNNPFCSPVEKELNELGFHDIILQGFYLSPWRKIFSFKFMKFLLNSSSKQRYWEEQLQNFSIPSGSDAAEAYLHLTKMLPEYFNAYLTSVMNFSASIMWTSYLIDTLSQGENKLTAEAIAVLCKNCPDALSTELPHSVEVIIQAVRDQGNSAEFAKMDSQMAVSWLLSADSREAGKAFQSFLKRHGFFSFGEAELRSKPWADDPTQLIPLIQRAVASNHISKKKTQTSVEEAIAAVNIPITGLRKVILPLLVRKARDGISKREYSKTLARKVYALFKTAYWDLARQMVKEGFLPDEDLLFFLTHSEVGEILQHRPLDIILRANRRKRILDQQNLLQFPEVAMGRPVPLHFKEVADLTAEAVLSGIIISQGVAKGTARVLKSVAEASSIQQGDILIVAIPEVGWTYYFPLLGGLVTEIGGILSHGGIIAREYGLPCIMKCKGATICFKSGDKVILDGFKGTVQKLEE